MNIGHNKPKQESCCFCLGVMFAELRHDLNKVSQQLEAVMASQADIVAQLNATKDQLIKIGGEITTLQTKVSDLLAVIAAGPVSPELQAAADALAAQAKVLDDMNPDAVALAKKK